MRRTNSLPLYLSATCLALLSACGHEGPRAELPASSGGENVDNRAVLVETARAQVSAVTRPVVATGSTQPVRASNLSPETTATILEVYVDEGDEVAAGDPLMRLNARTARLQAAQARAGAAAAEAQARQMAEDHRRMEQLAKAGAVGRAKVGQLRAARDAVQGQHRAARAAASLAGSMVGNTTVRAPFAGTVSAVMMEVGELASMMPPRVLLRLIDLSSVEVKVRVNEHDLARVARGDRVVARFPSLDLTREGAVTHVGLEIHPMTRTAEVVTTFLNDERQLRGGMFAELEIHPAEARQAVVLPRSAVGGSGDERYVYLADGCRAKRRPVQIESLGSGRVAVQQGITEGDMVVTRGVARLSDGARLRIEGNDECTVAAGPAAERAEAVQ